MMKFSKLLLGAVSLVAMSSAAFAADAVIEEVPVAGYNWSGFYVGVGVGAGANVAELSGLLLPGISLDGIGGEGVFGELTVGYDYMVSPRFLFGALADVHYSNIETRLEIPALAGSMLPRPTPMASIWACARDISSPPRLSATCSAVTLGRRASLKLSGLARRQHRCGSRRLFRRRRRRNRHRQQLDPEDRIPVHPVRHRQRSRGSRLSGRLHQFGHVEPYLPCRRQLPVRHAEWRWRCVRGSGLQLDRLLCRRRARRRRCGSSDQCSAARRPRIQRSRRRGHLRRAQRRLRLRLRQLGRRCPGGRALFRHLDRSQPRRPRRQRSTRTTGSTSLHGRA